MSRLQVVDLAKRYRGRWVINGVSFGVEAGCIVGLLGPNGAGKTTVFRLIAGVERPDRGSVRISDIDITRDPLHARARQGLAYLPQEDTLFRDLTVRGNVALAIEATGRDTTPEVLLARVGIEALAARRMDGLSGGERRRLAIARCLALAPSVLLLDEPFAGVDPVAVAGLQKLIRAIAAEGVAVLITDHAVRETLALCDRAMLIDGGIIQVQGTPSELAMDRTARDRYLGNDFELPTSLPSTR